jgi:hypothetical protein
MVQGLAFLSKKSWHTKNLANQERVWIEEQKKAAEDSKTLELSKQIQREREEEDLDRIAGRKTNRLDRGIDWMYQGVTSEAAKEDVKKQAEEYLLGKEFTGGPTLQIKGDLAQALDQNDGVNAVVTNFAADQPAEKFAPLDGPSVAERNEAFRVKHEDPMFLVSQKRREQVVKVEKTKALYEKVMGKVRSDDEDSRARRKREKKDRKKDRKLRKETVRSRRRRSRSASRSDSDRDDYRRRSPEYDRAREDSPENRRERSRHDDHKERHSPGRDYRSDRYSAERIRDDDRRRAPVYHDNDSRYERKVRDNDESFRATSLRHDRKTEDHKRDGVFDSFGLQGSSKSLNLKDLGPSVDLINRRHLQRDTEYRRKAKPDRRRMTHEEREQALKAMLSDAMRHDAKRKAVVPKEEEEERKSAVFLHEMAQLTHGVHGEHRTVAERVAQNRHTNQRPNDSF